MGMKKKIDLRSDATIRLGGVDKTTGTKNPTTVEGYFLGTKEVSTDYGPAKIHVFQTAEGNVSLFGKTNSNRLLTPDLVGQMVKLTFTGMGKAKKGRNAPYEFELQHDEDDRIDTSTVSLTTSAEEEEPDFDEAEEASYATAPMARIKTPDQDAINKTRNLLSRK